MRQYERQRESASRASTAASTPIPWTTAATDASDVSVNEVRELKAKIDMLSKLNYAKDVELQSQRAQMEAMQVRIKTHSSSLLSSQSTPGSAAALRPGTPSSSPRRPSTSSGRATPSVQHL